MISTRTLTIGVLVLALVTGAAAFSGAAAADAPAFAQADDNQTETPTSDGTDGEASISISDQETDGNTVVVDSATLPDGGFLVVYNDQQEFVGVSEFLEAGSHEDVTIELDQQLTYDQVVLVEAYRGDENNEFDKEAFTSDEEATETDENATEQPPANEPYVGDKDEQAGEEFPVSATAFVTITGNATDNGTATDTNATATETDADATATEADGDATETETGADDGVPGFGAALAVVALLAAALLAVRRTN